MNWADHALIGIIGLGALAIAYFGIRLIMVGDRALHRVAHTPDALSRVLGGRYVAMAGLLAAFLYLRDWKALMIALVAGAFMGVVDNLVEPKEHALPHLVVAIASVALAAAIYFTQLV